MQALIEFWIAWLFFFWGMKILVGCADLSWVRAFGFAARRRALQEAQRRFQEIEETLAAGLVPQAERWESLRELDEPWGSLAYESLLRLRESGGALLPTLRRLRALAGSQVRALSEAKARSSQAVAQAIGCIFLVPLCGATLYSLLPGVNERFWLWIGVCALAMAFALAGAFWMIAIAERARWAGLPRPCRGWILAVQCAGERFLSFVRSGTPADLAWVQACELLRKEAPALSVAWGGSIWNAPPGTSETLGRDAATLLLVEAGSQLRKAVQLSLMEGRPCVERVETALSALNHDIQSRVEAELTLLGTRALKPLFLCVAPSVFLMLGAGFFICFESVVA